MLCDGYKRLGRENEFVDLIGSRPHSLGLVPHGSASGTQALIKIDAYFIMGLAVDQVEELKAQMKLDASKYSQEINDLKTIITKQIGEQQTITGKLLREQEKKHTEQMVSMRMLIETSIHTKTTNNANTLTCTNKRCNRVPSVKSDGTRKKQCETCLTRHRRVKANTNK
jgi:hypothetical protein